jgi:acetyl/propionyl-CoA carboxylase alpha subunit
MTISLGNTSNEIMLKSVNNSEIKFSLEKEIIKAAIIDEQQQYIDIEISGIRKRVFYSWDKIKLMITLNIDYREFIFSRNDFLSREDFVYNRSFDSSEDRSKILAPLSGKIIKVNVDRNQIAQQGDTLIVIESMKMENEIKNSRRGQIGQIFVNQGQMVKEGDVLLELESDD